jgi:hypothetical protein
MKCKQVSSIIQASEFKYFQMEQSQELLDLLNTLIINVEDNTLIMNKETLQSVLTCLQVMHAKVRLLQDQSQLFNYEIMDLKNKEQIKCSEQVFV